MGRGSEADLDAGPVTEFFLKDLPPGTYYFTLTAYDQNGESGYGHIVSDTVLS